MSVRGVGANLADWMVSRGTGHAIEIKQAPRKRNAVDRPSVSEIPDDPLNV